MAGREKLVSAFQEAYLDDGKVTKEEMTDLLKQLNPSFTTKQVDQIFKAVDKNGNNEIEYGEFIAWLCEDNDDEPAGPSQGQLARNNTFSGKRAGRLFEMDRWKRALSGGAMAFNSGNQAGAIRQIVKLMPDLTPTGAEGLTLAEEFALLWCDPKTGQLAEYSYFGKDQPYHNAIFGACLLGLQARGCLNLVKKGNTHAGFKWMLELSETPPDNNMLKALHEELSSQPKYSLKDWFEEKGGKWGQDDTTTMVLEELVNRNILTHYGDSGAYSTETYKFKDHVQEAAIRERLVKVVNGEIPADHRSVALLALCRSADLRDSESNYMMCRIFGPGAAGAMTQKVDELVHQVVNFGGIGSEEINAMIEVLPGEMQQSFATAEFKEDVKQQFQQLSEGKGRIRPDKLASVMDAEIGQLVKEKLGVNDDGVKVVIKMFDCDQDGYIEEETFKGFLMWCHALTVLADED